MSQIEELKEQSRAAVSRSMKQVRAAALMAALVPLASIAVAPAMVGAVYVPPMRRTWLPSATAAAPDVGMGRQTGNPIPAPVV